MDKELDKLVAKALSDNLLTDTVDVFLHSDDTVYYVDRHVLDVPPGSKKLVKNGVILGLALLKEWLGDIQKTKDSAVFFSDPLLVVDDEWLEMRGNAPPPHIMLTLAKNPENVEQPRNYFKMDLIKDCPPALGTSVCLASKSMGVFIYRAHDDEEGGAFIFGIPQTKE